MSVTPSITIRVPFFFSSGIFRSARTEAFMNAFVEEFDASNRFVRGVASTTELVIVREDFWWFGGSRSFETQIAGPNLTFLNPVNGILTATPGFLYRAWVDMTVRIRAEGFGPGGGSGAIAQVGWTIDSIALMFR